MTNTKNSKSILALEKVIMDKLVFERFSDAVNKIDEEGTVSFNHSITQLNEDSFKVSLGISLQSDSKYNIFAQISGFFLLEENSTLGKKLIENNTVAILFPYLRSQLTLLSSQPGFEPIILPVMNINALLNNSSNIK